MPLHTPGSSRPHGHYGDRWKKASFTLLRVHQEHSSKAFDLADDILDGEQRLMPLCSLGLSRLLKVMTSHFVVPRSMTRIDLDSRRCLTKGLNVRGPGNRFSSAKGRDSRALRHLSFALFRLVFSVVATVEEARVQVQPLILKRNTGVSWHICAAKVDS